jgi:ATP-dependent RNA helicase SUPV3L1/SUV3
VEATTALLRQLKRWLGSPRLHALAEALRHAEATGGVEAAVARVLCPLFKHTAMRQVPRVLGSMDLAAGLAHAADMSSPGSWYPKARAMQRTIIFHMGPTNSGKTFQVSILRRIPLYFLRTPTQERRRGVGNRGKDTLLSKRTLCQALERYNTAESGVYASPLRLLAMEVWDQCNQRGTYCSLITGQEKEEVAFSQHTACTVEVSA